MRHIFPSCLSSKSDSRPNLRPSGDSSLYRDVVRNFCDLCVCLYISRVSFSCLLVAGAADTSAERAGPGTLDIDTINMDRKLDASRGNTSWLKRNQVLQECSAPAFPIHVGLSEKLREKHIIHIHWFPVKIDSSFQRNSPVPGKTP